MSRCKDEEALIVTKTPILYSGDRMCIARICKIKNVQEGIVTTVDGQKARTGPHMSLKPGEFAEVYADIVIRKIPAQEALDIQRVQKEGVLV